MKTLATLRMRFSKYLPPMLHVLLQDKLGFSATIFTGKGIRKLKTFITESLKEVSFCGQSSASFLILSMEVWPWVIVECFQPTRLDWLADLGYLIESLDDCGNYLLTPPTGVRHAA